MYCFLCFMSKNVLSVTFTNLNPQLYNSFNYPIETNKFMKHTVVIPLYNKEAFIFDTISSLAFQEKKPSQIIIVDDCSTDESLLRVKDALSFFAPQFLLRMFK